MIRRMRPLFPLTLVCLVSFNIGCFKRVRSVPHITSATLRSATTAELVQVLNQRVDENRSAVARGVIILRLGSGGSLQTSSDITDFLGMLLGSAGCTEGKSTTSNLNVDKVEDLLFLKAIGASKDAIFSYSDTRQASGRSSSAEIVEPIYILDVLREDDSGWHMHRRIKLERENLSVFEQSLYSDDGRVLFTSYYDDASNSVATIVPCETVMYSELGNCAAIVQQLSRTDCHRLRRDSDNRQEN